MPPKTSPALFLIERFYQFLNVPLAKADMRVIKLKKWKFPRNFHFQTLTNKKNK